MFSGIRASSVPIPGEHALAPESETPLKTMMLELADGHTRSHSAICPQRMAFPTVQRGGRQVNIFLHRSPRRHRRANRLHWT